MISIQWQNWHTFVFILYIVMTSILIMLLTDIRLQYVVYKYTKTMHEFQYYKKHNYQWQKCCLINKKNDCFYLILFISIHLLLHYYHFKYDFTVEIVRSFELLTSDRIVYSSHTKELPSSPAVIRAFSPYDWYKVKIFAEEWECLFNFIKINLIFLLEMLNQQVLRRAAKETAPYYSYFYKGLPP